MTTISSLVRDGSRLTVRYQSGYYHGRLRSKSGEVRAGKGTTLRLMLHAIVTAKGEKV